MNVTGIRQGTPHILVIDPAMRIPETECFNGIALASPLPCTYHLPAMYGLQSLKAEDMASVRGMIILGSSASVHDRLVWQEALENWLRPYLDRAIPTLGLCYGHQMLAHMYGSRVAYVTEDQTKLSGLRDVTLEATPCWSQGSRSLVVSHRETVVDVAPSFKIVARSATIPTDGLAHRSLPIWTFQTHPEATPEFLSHHGIAVDHAETVLPQGHELVRGFLRYAAGTQV